METLSTEAATDLLNSAKVGHIAVVDDGVPYVSPVSYVIINGEFCFRTGRGRRTNAIRENPKVSIEAMRETQDGGWECVIAAGEAREVDDTKLAQEIISGLLSKYRDEIGSPLTRGARNPIPEPATMIAVRLTEVSGRGSGSWFSIPTRPGRL